MKRSKLFLGITTGILAVVAFTAAKSAKFSNFQNAYYSNGSRQCTLEASLQFYSVSASPIQATSGLPKHALVYTFNSGGQCSNAAKLYATGNE